MAVVKNVENLSIGTAYYLFKKEAGPLVKQVGAVFKLSTVSEEDQTTTYQFNALSAPKWGKVNVIKIRAEDYSKKWFASTVL